MLVFNTNPYQVPEVDQIFADVSNPQVPPPGPPSSQITRSIATPGNDCFMSLPQELCAAIVMHLPTADVLSARLVSSAFWPVSIHSQQFWASRFKNFSDRSWLFEARRDSSRSVKDWRRLYCRTSDANIGFNLQNRKRIWALIQGVLDLLALVWNESPPSDQILPQPTYRVEVSGDLLELDIGGPYSGDFHKGCRTFRKQNIAIPDDLTRLSISTVSLGDEVHITGMSITSATGDSIRIGYNAALAYSEHSLELSELWGLQLAVGSGGIQALQCITGPTNSASLWLGCPGDLPRTKRLAVATRITALEAGFDVSVDPVVIDLTLTITEGVQDGQPGHPLQHTAS